MNEVAETKICPQCAETIKTAAKVCPHCRYWQKRWSLYNPQMLAGAWVLLCIGITACFGVFFDRVLGPKEQFATYRDDVAVVTSQFSHRISESNLLNTVIGTLTNRSDVAWKEVGVEAQFFDKAGKQIDVITAKADDYRAAAILPHGEVAFKIEGVAAQPETVYQTCKVSVRWAKAADAWP